MAAAQAVGESLLSKERRKVIERWMAGGAVGYEDHRLADRAALAEIDRLIAERADLLALLEVARRDTDGAELGAAREREVGVAHALGLARGFTEQRRNALALHDSERALRAEGAAAACVAVADLLRGGGPLLPAGPLETEQARADALVAENAQLKQALNGMVDACARVGFDGGPMGLLRRAVAFARKALGVGQ